MKMSKKAIKAIALLAMTLLTACCVVLAEETEELQSENNVTSEMNVTPEKNTTFIFVQNAQSGSLIPVEGEENLYKLTLMSVSPQTIAFSDRPERIVVQVPMQRFLDGLCFSRENPPNAALEILDADEDEDVAVVELFDPIYDNESQTLQYNVSFLEKPDHSYAKFNERADKSLPETFGAASLFIDDCPDGHVGCQNAVSGICGRIDTGCCWNWNMFHCDPCESRDYYENQCVKTYGSNCHRYGCDCFRMGQTG
jgi:hypothetical protein